MLASSSSPRLPPSPPAAAAPQAKVQAIPSSLLPHVTTPTRQVARNILGHETNVVIQEYVDRTFVLITQTGKIASITQASLPTTSSPYAPLSSPLGPAPTTAPDHDPFLDEDEENGSGPSSSVAAPAASTAAAATPPLAPPNLTQSPLFGTPPPGFATMQSLYVSTVYSLLRPNQADATVPDEQQQRDPRPVVVALGLKLNASGGAGGGGGGGGGGGDEDGEGDDVEQIAASEGPRFRAVVELVKECQGRALPRS